MIGSKEKKVVMLAGMFVALAGIGAGVYLITSERENFDVRNMAAGTGVNLYFESATNSDSIDVGLNEEFEVSINLDTDGHEVCAVDIVLKDSDVFELIEVEPVYDSFRAFVPWDVDSLFDAGVAVLQGRFGALIYNTDTGVTDSVSGGSIEIARLKYRVISLGQDYMEFEFTGTPGIEGTTDTNVVELVDGEVHDILDDPSGNKLLVKSVEDPDPALRDTDLDGDGEIDMEDYGLFVQDYMLWRNYEELMHRSDFCTDSQIDMLDYGTFIQDYIEYRQGS